MAKFGKRTMAARAAFAGKELVKVNEAVALVKDNANAKFDETFEISMQLGVDPRHADQISQQQCSQNERGFPNNDFGHGVIDAPTALAQLNRPITMAKSSKLFP